ncbi:MAG: Hsp70 family protein [Planctomycetes bacterium]|nr:Hsp70 family protein [Planctomycetota bacterium]
MLTTHAVGIDLGTTYSCIAYLNEHGEPVTLANQEGELSTPSVVLFDDDEVIVGTEALRNAIVRPHNVVQNSKRFMGDAGKRWVIGGRPYTPVDIATFVLKKLIGAAQEQIGPVERAVVTVPAQFSDAQRHATIEAGHHAGLQQVDVINEPVAAALCYVLGTEGLWFTELADEQRILVYDLGGGTFDLSLVKYQKNEVSVIASAGDLHLGGIDWNQTLQDAIADQFQREFGSDPRDDAESLQFLALEVEQAKRSLSVRPRAALTCQHAGRRKTYQIEQAQFEKLTKGHVDHTAQITQKMVKDRGLGWARVDVVLTTGGASRMPMVRGMLKKLSGRTLNTSLSPDQSIAHGATYYAGMLLTNSKFARSILNEKATARLKQVRQQSVNARALGIMVRDTDTNKRVPHYLISDHTPLPTARTENFGTVVPGQRRVTLQIVESGTSPEQPPVKLGECIIDDLPANLPEGSEVAVTIRYDEQARVHVEARDVTSGKEASVEIVRQENVVKQLQAERHEETDASIVRPAETFSRDPKGSAPTAPSPAPKPAASAAPSSKPAPRPVPAPAPIKPAEAPVPQRKEPRIADPKPAVRPAPKPRPVPAPPAAKTGGAATGGGKLESASHPIPLCNECGEPLDDKGRCPACGVRPAGDRVPPNVAAARRVAETERQTPKRAAAARRNNAGGQKPAKPRPRPRTVAIPIPPQDDEILELDDSALAAPPARTSKPKPKQSPATGNRPQPGRANPRPIPTAKGAARPKAQKPAPEAEQGEDEFWQLAD